MKLNKLASVCKKNKRAYILEESCKRDDGTGYVTQYISTGTACYPIFNMPRLEKRSLLTLFDIPEKDWESWVVDVREIPEGLNLKDCDADEFQIQWFFSPIEYDGEKLRCLGTRDSGILFLKESLLSPIETDNPLEYFERTNKCGDPYIAIKDGIMLQGVIMPYDLYQKEDQGKRFAEEVREFANRCGREVYNRQERERAKAAAEAEDDQCSMST